jgi:hypothetical protein
VQETVVDGVEEQVGRVGSAGGGGDGGGAHSSVQTGSIGRDAANSFIVLFVLDDPGAGILASVISFQGYFNVFEPDYSGSSDGCL